MKKIYLVALMSITTFAAAFAAEWESGIKVFGTQITSDNVSDLMSLFNDSEAEGTVTYDHATQTLTLTNVQLTSHDVWNNFFRFTSTAANKQFKVVVNGMCDFYNNGNKHSVFFAESGITITFEGGSSDPYKDAIQIMEGNGFCAENGTMIFRDVALDFTDVIFPLSGNSKSDLLALTREVLSDDPLFFLVSSYTTGLSASAMGYALSLAMKGRYGGSVRSDELGLPVTESGEAIPCGAASRWTAS